MATGLLGGVLPYIYSRADALKRTLGDVVSNPMASTEQAVNNANDRARYLNQLNAQVASQGVKGLMSPQGQELARLYADAYNPVGMTAKNVGSKIKVKPATDDVYEVMDATFNYGKLGGNKTIPIDKLTGGVRMTDPTEARRVKELADKISSPEGYISRIIVDDSGNVLEGQHRLEALRLLGEKNVPVSVIEDLSNKYDISAMENAIQGKLHPDQVTQLVREAIDTMEKAGSVEKALSDYSMPARFQQPFQDAIRASQKVTPTKIAPPAPQQAALDLAQQRAAKTGQSLEPYPRSLQQGYEHDWYHGSTGDIYNFRQDLLGETTGAQSARKGFFFARDPQNPPASMMVKTTDPDSINLLKKLGKTDEEIAALNQVSMRGSGAETASGYAQIGGSREYKEAMRRANEAEKGGDWQEYEKQMQIAEDSEINRMNYAQNMVAKYGDARDEMLDTIQKTIYSKNLPQAEAEVLDKKYMELMPYGWYNSFDTSQFNVLKKKLVDLVGEDAATPALKQIDNFKSVKAERMSVENTQEGGNVLPVALRYKNPMVYDFGGASYREQTYSDLVDQALRGGHDALILKNTFDPAGGQSKLIDVGVVFSPDQIRSRFAAFDPFRKDVATATAMGVALPDLLAQPVNQYQNPYETLPMYTDPFGNTIGSSIR